MEGYGLGVKQSDVTAAQHSHYAAMLKTMKAGIRAYSGRRAQLQSDKGYNLVDDGGSCKTSKLWSALIATILDRNFHVCAGVAVKVCDCLTRTH